MGQPMKPNPKSLKSSESMDAVRFFERLNVEFLIHELKDPLSVVETGVRTLLEKRDRFGPLSGRQEKTLLRVLRNAKKARYMLYGLLEVGRSGAGHMAPGRFKPVEVVCRAIVASLETYPDSPCEELEAETDLQRFCHILPAIGISLNVSCAASLEVCQDELKFQQVVGNLLQNALHHRRNRMDVAIYLQDNDLAVRVSDDGPGIDPKYHRLIFERYAQVDACEMIERHGHGLGLAGALILAKCLGGDIEVESKRGRGAVFNFVLPVVLAD